ncbi:MAG: ADP-ribosylation factor-like protein [Candidatus Heimdallarchaeaceae archaeon]
MKRFSIAITGLPQAGKTSFTQRLLTGSFISSQPTLGVDVEFAEYQGYPLQIWDLGGHMAFRKHIWKNYIVQSSALIFIFDASDLDKMEESSKWFWKCLSWIENKSIPILFLANKWDLVKDKEESMEKIVQGFKLNDLVASDTKRSFRFYFISVKTGEYLSDAMNWLILKHFVEKHIVSSSILTLDLFVSSEHLIMHIHDNTANRVKVEDIIKVYKRKWLNSFESKSLNSLEEINYQDYKAVFFSYPRKALLITTSSDFIEKGPFINLIEKLDKFDIKLEDEVSRYQIFEKIKDELSKSFHPHLAKTLSCEITIIE